MSSPARRGPGRPRHPIDRRDLINIAAKVFAELGYTAASLGEIAEAAGLRKASLYHHFATKEALYTAVLDTAVLELRSLLITARLDHGAFDERLDRLGSLIIDYFAAHPHAANLLSRELHGESDYMRGAGGEQIQQNLQATAAFLEAGMDAGAFRRQHPGHLALSIVGLHIFYFGAAAAAGRFLEGDVFAAKRVAERKAAVLGQVRALCLASEPPNRPTPSPRKPRSR